MLALEFLIIQGFPSFVCRQGNFEEKDEKSRTNPKHTLSKKVCCPLYLRFGWLQVLLSRRLLGNITVPIFDGLKLIVTYPTSLTHLQHHPWEVAISAELKSIQEAFSEHVIPILRTPRYWNIDL